jgi:hypothetical protein
MGGRPGRQEVRRASQAEQGKFQKLVSAGKGMGRTRTFEGPAKEHGREGPPMSIITILIIIILALIALYLFRRVV